MLQDGALPATDSAWLAGWASLPWEEGVEETMLVVPRWDLDRGGRCSEGLASRQLRVVRTERNERE